MLHESFALGPVTLANRIVMAPMTRARAETGEVIGRAGQDYYVQRASAGLIITEGSQISPQGRGYVATPGIHADAQVAGWRRVTAAVHEAGGLIFCQLWHVGRVSHPDLQPVGGLPVAPSAIPSGAQIFTAAGFQPAPVPRALDLEELPGIVGQFRHAAMQAMAAGFDGVELHAAGGYLLDQFMRDGANRRSDRYGGSLTNRLRLMLEVTQAVVDVVGEGRTGVRIAPNATHNGIFDSDPEQLFSALTVALNDHPLAYLHVIEATGPENQRHFDLDVLRTISRHPYMVAMDYDGNRAEQALRTGRADLVAFGRAFIANPDLPRRMAEDIPLAIADPEYFYGGGRQGYTDYPAAP